MSTDANREAWLQAAVKAMASWFPEGTEIKCRISVGWPGGRSQKGTRGQCWPTVAAEDEVSQIFISPVQTDTLTTLAIVLHEMVHAADDCSSGHRGNFITIARQLGFKSKWTCSDNRTDELDERLKGLAERLGDFPSAAILVGSRAADTPAKQGTRMLKVECPDDGYIVRTTAKWLDVGNPICPCGTEMVPGA